MNDPRPRPRLPVLPPIDPDRRFQSLLLRRLILERRQRIIAGRLDHLRRLIPPRDV